LCVDLFYSKVAKLYMDTYLKFWHSNCKSACMCNVNLISFLLIFNTIYLCNAQSPAITYASSFYKTTAGAIGPHGVVATTSFELKLASHKTIILESVVIAGLAIDGDGIIIPTNKEGTISFRIIIYTHQKDSVWYNGELEFEGIRVSSNAQGVSNTYQNKKDPAVILYLRSNKTNYVVVKNEFDQEESQYNK
jgi:hypothetical protein